MEFSVVIIGIAVGVCIGIILGERHNRKANIEEVRDERFVLKEALGKIQETHNMLVRTQSEQAEMIHDLNQKVSFLVQGVKGR